MMFNRCFNFQTKTVVSAAFLLGFSAGLSRLLGLVRDRLLAARFGAGPELDIYFAAFRIPDFVYAILIMGGISAVFLPIFSQYFRKSQEEGWKLTSQALNCFFLILIVVCGILAIFTPQLLNLVAPGFTPEQKALAVSLTRLMFFSPIFFGLSSIFSGVLHYFNRFFVYSLAPIFYNLGIIFGILFFLPFFGLKGLAYGVILGAFFHWIIQLPAARDCGFRYFPILNFHFSGLRRIFKLMIPRTIGAAAYQINLIIITALASTLGIGAITIFNFSNNLQHLPIGLIGASFALVAFPALSRSWAAGRKEKFLEDFSSIFRQILFLVSPLSLLFFFLRAQIVRLVLGAGEFGWWEIRLTSASLGLFCLGIFAFTLIPFLVRVFYSFQDTKTPLAIGLASMALNITLCFLFIWLLTFPNFFRESIVNLLKLQGIEEIAIVGLPLALSLAGLFQFFLLLIYLKKKMKEIKLKAIWLSFQKIILASLLMASAVYFTLQLTSNFLDLRTFKGIFFQTSLAGLIGISFYILISFLLKLPEIKTIKSLIFK